MAKRRKLSPAEVDAAMRVLRDPHASEAAKKAARRALRTGRKMER
jgi:hypothetical protein